MAPAQSKKDLDVTLLHDSQSDGSEASVRLPRLSAEVLESSPQFAPLVRVLHEAHEGRDLPRGKYVDRLMELTIEYARKVELGPGEPRSIRQEMMAAQRGLTDKKVPLLNRVLAKEEAFEKRFEDGNLEQGYAEGLETAVEAHTMSPRLLRAKRSPSRTSSNTTCLLARLSTLKRISTRKASSPERSVLPNWLWFAS